MSRTDPPAQGAPRPNVMAPMPTMNPTRGRIPRGPFRGDVRDLPLGEEPRTAQMTLGKRVVSELAGTQAFFENPATGELTPWKPQTVRKPPKTTVKSTAEMLGMTPYAVRRIFKAYEAGGDQAVESL